MRRTRIYIAAPFTQGDQFVNVRDAVLVGAELWRRGYAPFVPHLNALWHLLAPLPWEEWLSYDLEWLPCCDALLRIPRQSVGADYEEHAARIRGLPVFYDLETLCARMPCQQEEGT